MLIYIIGSVSGNPNYREQFAYAEAALRRGYSCDIINPAARGDMSQSDYARLSYNAVCKADAIAVLWTVGDSFGATMEWLIALDAGKRIIEVDEDYKVTDVTK